ncbi:MAG TPA: helix-turn-helix transcriptional regulator [Candidatus Faecimonas intestinavium]|nr:helix-turn-helix transcriptional regulator [Candidatus Faecimonas intestinavium]
MKFGENLQKLRKEKGISQEQLAEQLGVTRQSVSKWESGNSYPEMDKIVAICNLFHCDMDVLINKDITEEREKKDASSVVKEIFSGVTNYVKKTIYLFEHKSLKDIIKMCVQVFIVICVILLFAIPFMLLKEIVVSLFYTGNNWFSIFFAKFWNFIFNGGYAILAIATFLYIFKIKFLDNEEIIVEEVEDKTQNSEEVSEDNSSKTASSKSSEKKKVKIIKVKKNDFSLLDLLVKAITVCLKCLFVLFLIPIIIGTIMLLIGLVLLIVLIFKGLFLAGTILLFLGGIVFAIVLIELMLDFIFNLKFSKRRIIITIISSIVVSSIGLGLSIWYFLNLNVINDVPTSFNTETHEEVYTMTDAFLVHYDDYSFDTKFVEDNSLTNQVRVRIDYYTIANDVSLERDKNEVYLNYNPVEGVNIKQITDSVINDLKNNEIHTYDQLGSVSITITTSKTNIEKIKDNYQKYLDTYY